MHAVLERLFDLPPEDRTPQAAAALVGPQWERLVEQEPELAGLFETPADVAAPVATSASDSSDASIGASPSGPQPVGAVAAGAASPGSASAGAAALGAASADSVAAGSVGPGSVGPGSVALGAAAPGGGASSGAVAFSVAEALPGMPEARPADEMARLEAFLASAGELLDGYFAVEDPRRLQPAEREALVSTLVDDDLLIRGYIDRLDVSPAGDLRVVDYKTGGAPREAFEGRALFQLKFYALVLWRTRGVVPRVLRLLYLKDAEICDYSPDAEELERFERTLVALSQAIERAKQDKDFRPKPSRLCGWCSHQQFCPEFGGTPPPYPERTPDASVPQSAPSGASLPPTAPNGASHRPTAPHEVALPPTVPPGASVPLSGTSAELTVTVALTEEGAARLPRQA